MITREEAVQFLERAIEARKVLDDMLIINHRTVFWCASRNLMLCGAEDLARLLGVPYIRKSFSENCDKIMFHWKGYEVYDLDFDKRIAHIKA